MAETVEWAQYLRWNRAVADVVYQTSNAGQPVYLDMTDEVLEAIRDFAEPDSANAIVGLVRAVAGVMRFDEGPAVVLRSFIERLDWWEKGDPEDAPPTLALLALLSLAAENMREGDGKAAHNFYGRLAELLGLHDKQREDLIAGYRRPLHGRATSDILWGSLSLWLELLEGNRGLVTVFADRNVHVSLPMSQALVREVDRDKFRTMFALYGLAPHSTMPVVEIGQVIDDWMSHEPCPASNQLERLWKRDSDARERIADVARLTLESWDGSGVRELSGGKLISAHADHVRVRARVRSFPRKGVELSLLLPAGGDADVETVQVLGPVDEVIGEIDLIPAASGWMGLSDAGALDASSYLCGETKLRRADAVTMLRRRPRRVVPLRFDDLLQGYLECDRVNLGDDFMLVVHEEVAPLVERALEASARPGYERIDEFEGLPGGWVLFDRVQILSSISPDLVQRLDLMPLQPIASSQAALQGGLVLPGNIKKWSSRRPPELRVMAEDGCSTTATITSIRAMTSPAPEPVTNVTEEPVLIWDLGAQHLADGDYEIEISVDGLLMGRPMRLRLRSADHPALVLGHDVELIGHDPGDPAFGLLATSEPSPRSFRVAPLEASDLNGEGAAMATPQWFSARKEAGTGRPASLNAAAIHVPGLPGGSCMLNGAHLFKLETVYPGQPRQKLIDGVCEHCGLTKRFPTHGRRKRIKQSAERQGPAFDPGSMPPVRSRGAVDWGLGLDALSHLRSGPISSLERIAAQIDPTGLFADTFARRLEALAHIEIHRSATTLKPVSWSMNPPSLVELKAGCFALVGFRSESMVAEVEDVLYRRGIALHAREIGGPPVLSIQTCDQDVLDEILEQMDGPTGLEPQLIPAAALGLAASLQPLSTALKALPKTSATMARNIERWDPLTARFFAVPSPHAAGAYRLKTFGNVYIYRRDEDIEGMTATLGDARMVKYAAALDAGLPLVGYDEPARVLYAPLGADLPGLYGRAAVLASGRPPLDDREQGLLRYHGVPPDLAARLQSLLMS